MTEQELNQVRDLHKKIRDLEKLLATLRSRAEDIVPAREGLPQSSDIQSKVENLALKIVEKTIELESLHEQILAATATLTESICLQISDPNQRTVMLLRYVHCMHFRDIGFQTGYSDRKVFSLHHDALKKFAVEMQFACS